jgi:hypothetical protein
MKTLFFCAVALMTSIAAHAQDRVTPCNTESFQTASGAIKSFTIQLLASNSKGFHTMKINKIEGDQITKLPSLEIFHRSAGSVSEIVSVETRQTVMAYRERASSTREGEVLIKDGKKTLLLKMTCYN